jgi:hypothetical protein
MKYLSIIFFILLSILACKKDEPADTCKNGFLDIGELGVDCGGKCPDCEKVYIPGLSIKLNGAAIPFENRSFTQENNFWYLKFWNDSIQVQVEIGEDIVVDSLYNINSINTFATIDGIIYPLKKPYPSSNVGIIENIVQDSRISGLFEIKLYRNGFTDTMRITSGRFDDLPY